MTPNTLGAQNQGTNNTLGAPENHHNDSDMPCELSCAAQGSQEESRGGEIIFTLWLL